MGYLSCHTTHIYIYIPYDSYTHVRHSCMGEGGCVVAVPSRRTPPFDAMQSASSSPSTGLFFLCHTTHMCTIISTSISRLGARRRTPPFHAMQSAFFIGISPAAVTQTNQSIYKSTNQSFHRATNITLLPTVGRVRYQLFTALLLCSKNSN